MIDTAEVIQRIREYQERIRNLQSRPGQDFDVNKKILENDLDDFTKKTFAEGSKDFKELDWRLNPMYGHSAKFEGKLRELDAYAETLVLIQHRLDQGQSELRDDSPNEVVIEAGTPHSAYVALRDIIAAANTRLRFVDPYVRTELLPLLSNVSKGATVQILTHKSKTKPDFVPEVAKFTAQHGIAIEVRWGDETFHDRFLYVDDKLYMSGASFQDLGKKLSFVTEVESVKSILSTELDKRWTSGSSAQKGN